MPFIGTYILADFDAVAESGATTFPETQPHDFNAVVGAEFHLSSILPEHRFLSLDHLTSKVVKPERTISIAL